METAIRTENLTRDFGPVRAVDGLAVEVLAGTVFGFLGPAVLSLLSAGFAANAGILASLRASSVRQAQQSLSIPIMLLLFVPVFGFRALPDEWKVLLSELLLSADPSLTVFALAVVLVALDGLLLAAAIARFQRARLILD